MKNINYDIMQTEPNGNCFFESVVNGLKTIGIDKSIEDLRKILADKYDKEVFMENDKVYKVDLTPMSTSNFFKKGHQIRIEISSSNFPRFARNLNTGGNNYDEIKSVTANNKIHHSKKYPSSITLPIIKK